MNFGMLSEPRALGPSRNNGLITLLAHALLPHTVTDMKYIFPDEGRQSLFLRELPKLGRVWIQRLRSSDMWKTRRDAYIKRAGVEAACADKFLEMHNLATKLGASTDTKWEDRLQLYTVFATAASDFHTKLRKGCTAETQASMLQLLASDTEAIVEATEPDVERAKLVVSVLAQCTVKQATDLQTKVTAKLQEWLASAIGGSLVRACQGLITDGSGASADSVAAALGSLTSTDMLTGHKDVVANMLLKSFEMVTGLPDTVTWKGLRAIWDKARCWDETVLSKDMAQMCENFYKAAQVYADVGEVVEALSSTLSTPGLCR